MEKPSRHEPSLISIETPYGVFWTREVDFVNQQLREYGGHQRGELGMIRAFAREGDVILVVDRGLRRLHDEPAPRFRQLSTWRNLAT